MRPEPAYMSLTVQSEYGYTGTELPPQPLQDWYIKRALLGAVHSMSINDGRNWAYMALGLPRGVPGLGYSYYAPWQHWAYQEYWCAT